MTWRKTTFLDGIRMLLEEFQKCPNVPRLSLILRTPDEYTVLDEWFLDQIKHDFVGSTLRVCMWLNREEAAELIALFPGGK